MSIPFLLVIIFAGLTLSAVAKRINFSSELLIVIVMGAVSFIPFVPRVELDGTHLLEIILPPMLFSAARNLSGYKFRKMRGPILYLGVLLIFFTAAIVALVTSLIAGFMTFTAGLILGAVVAPPDAVSSVSIGKKLGLPERVMTILTGESLINDAASLTLFTFAVDVVFRRERWISHPVTLFAWTAAVGLIVGIVVGIAVVGVRKILKEANLIAVFTALAPFATYLLAESFEGSGVLAVVMTGLIVEKTTYRSSHITRLQEQSLWHSIETLIDSFVFAYIGLQIRYIITDLIESKLDTLWTISVALLILLTVMLIRPLGVLGFNALRQIWFRSQLKRTRHFVFYDDEHEKLKKRVDEGPMSWREYTILSWTGMRGVVTLAAASSVPRMLDSDSVINPESPQFHIHIFILVVGLIVTIGTLLCQGLTLPLLIKKVMPPELDLSVNDRLDGQWGKARKLIEDSALRIIDEEYDADPDNFDREHVIEVWKSLDASTIAKDKRDISFIPSLLTEIVEAQREDMQNAARNGEIHPDVAKEFLSRLDYKLASFTVR